jgi:hypothetical protein
LRSALQKSITAHEAEQQRYKRFAEGFTELQATLSNREAEAEQHFEELQRYMDDMEILEERIESQYCSKIASYQQIYHRQQLSWWDNQIADQARVNDSRVEAALQMPPLKILSAQAKANVERAHASHIDEADQLLSRQVAAEEVLLEKKTHLLMVVRDEKARIKEKAATPVPGSAAERRADIQMHEELTKVRGEVQTLWEELGWQPEEMLLHVQGRVAQMKPTARANQLMRIQLEKLRSESGVHHLRVECEAREHELHSLQDNDEVPHELLEEVSVFSRFLTHTGKRVLTHTPLGSSLLHRRWRH